MRLDEKIVIRRVERVPDGFGGYTETSPANYVIMASVSVSSNDLKPLPSGLGYYRMLTIVVDSHPPILKDDSIMVNGVEFKIAHEINIKSTVYKAYKGYEV